MCCGRLSARSVLDRSRPILLVAIGLLLASVGFSATTYAQLPAGGSGRDDRIEGRTKFLPLPYLDYDRSLGGAIGFVPILMFNPVEKDKVSPSSIVGGFGMYTTNKSWAGMGFSRLYLKQDTWRVTAAAGAGSINFQFYLDGAVGGWIPYNTAANFAYVGIDRRVWRDLFVGISYVYVDFDTSVEEVPETLETELQGIGLNLSVDRRSSVWYPRGGFQTKAKFTTYPAGLGNEDESSVIEFEYDHYVSLRDDRDVVAARAYAGVGLGDLAFNQQFIVGQGVDIRGYPQGEYRGDNLLAAQGEYRWNLRDRLGLVGFAGIATIIGAINEEDEGKLLPGGGIGVRYTVETETHMNIGLDFAVGRGDWGIYFRLGEAF